MLYQSCEALLIGLQQDPQPLYDHDFNGELEGIDETIVMPSDDLDVLRLKGSQIDMIVEVSPTFAETTFHAIEAFLAEARQIASGVDSGLRRLARLLVANTNHLRERSEEDWDLQGFTEFCAHMERQQSLDYALELDMPDAIRRATEYWIGCSTASYQRRVARTRKGFLGMFDMQRLASVFASDCDIPCIEDL